MKIHFFWGHALTVVTKNDKPWIMIRDLTGLIPNPKRNLIPNLPPNEVIEIGRLGKLVSPQGLQSTVQSLSWEHRTEFVEWLSKEFDCVRF